MIPKEKANELVNKFYIQEIKYYENIITAKECATIAVDEIIIAVSMCYSEDSVINYWKDVREELKTLPA